jgi:H+-transporting ATPase
MSNSIGGKFSKMSPKDALKELNVDPKKGLTSAEAEKRLEQYGENALSETRESKWKKLFSFFWGPIPWMIEAAAILSGALHRWPDLIMIVALLLINAALGFVQESKADDAIQALKDSLALRGRAMRDGKWKDIDAKYLVPGDCVQIKLGNIVPADVLLIEGEYLSVDQAALTGESLPVDKVKGDSAFSGTTAKLGEMVGLVTETGMETFFGKTARLVDTAEVRSHFQQAIVKIGNFLIFTTLAICTVIFITDIYRVYFEHTSQQNFGDIIIFILVLVIAGIPVALPAVLSVTMAVGASRLAKLKAIVSKLTAIEEIAGMDILCSDKTGTLTKNLLTVHDVILFDGKEQKDVLKIAALASKPDSKDAIDDAIIGRLNDDKALAEYSCEKLIPFDPVRKRIEATVKDSKGKEMLCVKGAPQVVLDLTKPTKKLEDEVNKEVIEAAGRGFRTLGVAKKEGSKWTFLGLIPLFDPPREDTLETVRHAKDLGVDVKMVTGDHTAIAIELSGQLELGTNICPVGKMFADDVSPEQKSLMLTTADGFAEVFPEHKFNIVQSLQQKGHIVGMTGDGVNDAPALKQADIGIAVSGATDAARAAADLVLTEPGLITISHAIEEARRIFGRMKSYAMYRISETVRLLLFLFLAMLVFDTHPLSAIMIIFIALLNDLPIMMIAYDNMPIHKNPVTWDMKEILVVAVAVAVIGVISSFGLYWIGARFWHLDFAHLQTLSFMAILCGGNLTIYLTRNAGLVWVRPFPEWKFMCATMFSLVVGTFASVYGLGTSDFVGIGWGYVGMSWAYIAVWFIFLMFFKAGLYKMLGHKAEYHTSYLDKQVDKHMGQVGLK